MTFWLLGSLAATTVADGDPSEPDVRVLSAPGLDELVERRLGDGVRRESRPWWGERRAHRRQVQGPAVRLGEVGDGGGGDDRRASDVDVEDPPPGVDVGVDETGQRPDRRRVHKGVDAPEVGRRLPDGGRDRRRLGDVALDGQRARPRLSCGSVEPLAPASEEGDLCTPLREPDTDAAAEPTRRPDDHSSHAHVPL